MIILTKTFDESRFPVDLFQVDFNGAMTKDDMPIFKKYVKECLENKNPFVVVFNMLNISSIKPKRVIESVAYLKKYESVGINKLIACSVIIENKVIIDIFTALSSMSKSVYQNTFTNNLDDGKEFLQDVVALYKIKKRKEIK